MKTESANRSSSSNSSRSTSSNSRQASTAQRASRGGASSTGRVTGPKAGDLTPTRDRITLSNESRGESGTAPTGESRATGILGALDAAIGEAPAAPASPSAPSAPERGDRAIDLVSSLEGDLGKLNGQAPNASQLEALERLGDLVDDELKRLGDAAPNQDLQRALALLDQDYSAPAAPPEQTGIPR
jgi:hypothetical protein